jgi:Rps23 Pro-64 3,4-dihydroxylase Tpa1-like proline 4-hydroxylase
MQFNAGLKANDLARRFRQNKRLVIRDVLTPHVAEQIHTCLAGQVKWGLAYQDEHGPQHVEPARLDAMPRADLEALTSRIEARATQGFQFRYRCYPMLDAYLQRRDPGLLLHQVFEFINAPTMLDFVRGITGMKHVVRADAQATLFAPGDFLTLHNDFDAQKGRLVAYVMGFTKNWRPDYGGMLQFMDDKHNVEQGFLPHFNSLMLFSVPQLHAVTYVPPFAPIGRYSITGWFQDATGVPAATKARYGL